MTIPLLHRTLLRIAAFLVPRTERAEWLAEWRAELWYARESRAEETAFCLGAFNDALWLRRAMPRRQALRILRLKSPTQCLAFLSGLAAISVLTAFLLHGASPPPAHGWVPLDPIRGFLLTIGMACVILPATTTLSLGDYPLTRHAPSLKIRTRRWIFLAAKTGLILSTLYAIPLVLAPGPLMIHARLWGSIFAFRWILRDQRKRCPVCLRLLANPVRVGQAAGYFLEWNCTEFMCLRGHGLLYVPENPTSWFNAQRWLYLDASWSSIS